MNIKYQKPAKLGGLLTLLLMTLALTLSAVQADSSTPPGDPDQHSPFIFPLSLPALVERSDASPLASRLCDFVARSFRCPESAIDNGVISGHSSIDDITTESSPHLHVSFVVQEMENELVSGEGANLNNWAGWETTSPIASVEEGGPYGLPAPNPGEVWAVPDNNQIYEAIVLNGCGSTPNYPVEFSSWINEMEDIVSPTVLIGQFDAVDNNTLQSVGFWNFNYTIRANGKNGVSDFHVSGVVCITCTHMDTLD